MKNIVLAVALLAGIGAAGCAGGTGAVPPVQTAAAQQQAQVRSSKDLGGGIGAYAVTAATPAPAPSGSATPAPSDPTWYGW